MAQIFQPLVTGVLWLAALSLFHSTAWAAQAPAGTPAYVERGRQTEARQRAYHDRIERVYRALSDDLGKAASDLLATLAAPPPDVHGYQILPNVGPDATPPPPETKSEVRSYSWRWSDTLIEREMAALERLEAGLAQGPRSGAGRATYEKLAQDYRTIVAHRKSIDADIQYNWLWQANIARNRPLFDRLNKIQQSVLAREAIKALRADAALTERAQSITREIVAATGWVALPDFVRVEHPARGQWLVTVPLSTDITDALFVQTFRSAVETVWHVRSGSDEFRVRLAIEAVSPERLYCGGTEAASGRAERCAPPAKGAGIDLQKHVARFPPGAVLTTGATTLQVTAGRAIVLGPHDTAPRVLAHEFGHILGFPDAYFRGYRDLGADGFQVTELVDPSNIMGAPGVGPVLARHFERLIAAREAQRMMGIGLDALYQRNNPAEAAVRFREVLERNPDHYGATLQLAKALDRSGKTDEALALWKKMLEMADAAQDDETARTVRARLAVAR